MKSDNMKLINSKTNYSGDASYYDLKSRYIEENNKTVSERLKKLRNEKNISLQELADLTNISKSALQRYEKGSDIPFSKLEIIAEKLSVSTLYLLYQESKDLPNEYYNNIANLLLECGYKIKYEGYSDTFYLIKDGIKHIISSSELKSVIDEIKSFASYKMDQIISSKSKTEI